MLIKLNGSMISVADGSVLSELIDQQSLQANTFACAVNSFFVPRSDYQSYLLKQNDEVEIVTAMQGG